MRCTSASPSRWSSSSTSNSSPAARTCCMDKVPVPLAPLGARIPLNQGGQEGWNGASACRSQVEAWDLWSLLINAARRVRRRAQGVPVEAHRAQTP